jgi:CBS domain-containing membrane protein
MASADIRHLAVVEPDGRLCGIITERDLFRHALADTSLDNQRGYLAHIRVEDVMAVKPRTVAPDTELKDAGRTMFILKYGCLPVIEGGVLVGMLTESDFVRMVMG